MAAVKALAAPQVRRCYHTHSLLSYRSWRQHMLSKLFSPLLTGSSNKHTLDEPQQASGQATQPAAGLLHCPWQAASLLQCLPLAASRLQCPWLAASPLRCPLRAAILLRYPHRHLDTKPQTKPVAYLTMHSTFPPHSRSIIIEVAQLVLTVQQDLPALVRLATFRATVSQQ